MAVKKKSKNQPRAQLISRLKQPKAILAILIILGIIGFGVHYLIRAHQASVEKQEFLSNQQELEGIADKISAQNKPDERKSEQYCKRTSGFKYERGSLYCVVQVQLSYNNINYAEANTIVKESSYLSGTSGLRTYNVGDGKNVKEFTNTPYKQVQYLFQDLNIESSKLDCGVSYVYPYPLLSDKDLTIILSCRKSSRTELFNFEK